MRKRNTNLILAAVLTTLLGATSWPTASLGADTQLAQVVYITMSKACDCTLVHLSGRGYYGGERV